LRQSTGFITFLSLELPKMMISGSKSGTHSVVDGGGDTMPTYEDLIALAHICHRQALTVPSLGASAALFRLAHEYKRRAAEMTLFPNPQFSLEPAKEAAE
jgi:hypothetical protein